jgi:predicted nucleic-acid-binding protein
MLGLDTNVLVRFLVRDDAEQFERARQLIRREVGRGEPVLVSLLVLLETEWVLRSRYALPKADILAVLSSLLEAAELEFEDEGAIEEALFTWRDSNAQFADCLIGARHRQLGCRATATFDSKAAKLLGFVAAL